MRRRASPVWASLVTIGGILVWMGKRTSRWQLPPDEVLVDHSWLRSSGGRAGNLARTSRAAGTQTGTVRLTHTPTGLRVEGSTATGSFSRKEMAEEMSRLQAELFGRLEGLVARHLRLPGR